MSNSESASLSDNLPGKAHSAEVSMRRRLAREAALRALPRIDSATGPRVEYQSRGVLLVTGPASRALPAARRLAPALKVVAIVSGHTASIPKAHGMTVMPGRVVALEGHLGQFSASAAAAAGAVSLSPLGRRDDGCFDLVLDLGDSPLLDIEVLPLGYFAPRDDEPALERALAELPTLVGKSSKPRYVEYRPDRCVHGRKRIVGCTACLEACPTRAIRSAGDQVAVDVHLCQGCAGCTVVCPTAALTYAPLRRTPIAVRLATALDAYFGAGGDEPWVFFHNSTAGREWVQALGPDLPPSLLPLEIPALATLGVENWLSALAQGAAGVILLDTGDTTRSALTTLHEQLAWARRILAGLGYNTERVRLATVDQIHEPPAVQTSNAGNRVASEAHPGVEGKRAIVFEAVEKLASWGALAQPAVDLPDGSPFGEARVDQDACTMCLACVTLCPTGALNGSRDGTQLNFVERDCVQCGLCVRGCPEQAISLTPRLLFESGQRDPARTLNTAEPARCVECGSPFMPRALLEASAALLSGETRTAEEQRRILQVCPRCRAEAGMRAQILERDQ